MNILLVAKAFPPETGGVETYSEQVALAYAQSGHHVTVLTACPGPLGLQDRDGLRVFNVGQSGGQAGVFTRMMRWLLQVRDRSSFDVVHATTWRVALPVLLWNRRANLVLTVHGREVFVVPKPLRPAMRFVLRRARHIAVVSQPILDKLEAALGQALPNAFPNLNGISFLEESATEVAKPDAFTLFTMCRMVERKNIATAIQAVAGLIHEGLALRYFVAGSGPELETLKALLAELNVEDSIKVLGRIPDEDVVPYYQQSHVFLHPQVATETGNDLEGFGLTIADGMAFGCVPIAGASGGPLDFVTPGQTGMLVQGENMREIQDAIRHLYEHPQERDALAAKTRSFARDTLTWQRHVEKITQRF